MDSCLLHTMQVKQLRWKTLLRALRTRSLGEMPCAQPAHFVPKRLRTSTARHPGQPDVPASPVPDLCPPSLAFEKPPFLHLSNETPILSSWLARKRGDQCPGRFLGLGLSCLIQV